MAPTLPKAALRLVEERWCLFIAPSSTSSAWIEAVTTALLQSGYVANSPVDYSKFGDAPPRRVMIVEAVTTTELELAPHWVVVMPASSEVPFALAGTDLRYLIQYGRNASALLAPLMDLPWEDTAVFTEAELSGRSTVELLPDLWVPIPTSTAPFPDAKDAQAVAAAMSLYEIKPTPSHKVVEWPPEFFLTTVSKTVETIDGKTIDLTGSPRPVVWGPHFHMPSGCWKLRIRFSIDENASRCAFSFEWGDLTSYSNLRTTPGAPGFYEVILEHEWQTPSVAEMRISVTEGVFDGSLTFSGASVEHTS